LYGTCFQYTKNRSGKKQGEKMYKHKTVTTNNNHLYKKFK